jgi:hypothetical protein
VSETATTPNDMPTSVTPETETAATAVESPETTNDTSPAASPSDGDKIAVDRAELDRLRASHKEKQNWRREATDNHRDAEAYRNLLGALGVKDGKEAKAFDPQAAISELNAKFESEQRARMLSEVARTEGLEPEDITGGTEEEMRASAQRLKARIEAEVEKRAKVTAPEPSAAPAGEVTSNGKVTGPQQVKSLDQLKNMSPKQIIEAREKGLLDDLQTGNAT